MQTSSKLKKLFKRTTTTNLLFKPFARNLVCCSTIMEEQWMIKALLARKDLLTEFMRENRKFNERFCVMIVLRNRMRQWCLDLLDDLTLIDAEDIDYSTYRKVVDDMRELIDTCWHDIKVSITKVYKDVGWLLEKMSTCRTDIVNLWWLIAEEVNKCLQRIEDFISRFYRLHFLFVEMVETYLELFRERSLAIFEKYKDY